MSIIIARVCLHSQLNVIKCSIIINSSYCFQFLKLSAFQLNEIQIFPFIILQVELPKPTLKFRKPIGKFIKKKTI